MNRLMRIAFPVLAASILAFPIGASAAGTVLAYQAGVGPVASPSLTWFDRTGTKIGTVGQQNRFAEIRLSPDEKLAAVASVIDLILRPRS